MNAEEYALHKERVMYLSEHPLVERDPDRPDTRQITLTEAFAA